MSKIYIALGNGFSINLIELLGKEKVIDLRNLFSQGDNVPWPDNNEKGFLSRKYCNNLWTLGARTTMTQSESNTFISCAANKGVHILHAVPPHSAFSDFNTALHLIVVAVRRFLDVIIFSLAVKVNVLVTFVCFFFTFMVFLNCRSCPATAFLKS